MYCELMNSVNSLNVCGIDFTTSAIIVRMETITMYGYHPPAAILHSSHGIIYRHSKLATFTDTLVFLALCGVIYRRNSTILNESC